MTGEDFNSQRRTDGSVSNQADDRSGISRRSCIKGAAVAGIAATALTTSAATQSSSVPHAEKFSTVVNVVEDYGVANDGSQSIVPALYRAKRDHGDDTLFYFPEGEYYVDRQFTWDGFRNIGFVGERSDSTGTGGTDDTSVGAGGSADNSGSSAIEDETESDDSDQSGSGSDDGDQNGSESDSSDQDDAGSDSSDQDEPDSTGGNGDSSDTGASQEASEPPQCPATVGEDVQDTQTGAWTSDGGNLATFVPATYSDFRANSHEQRMFRLGQPEDWGTPGNRLVFEGFDVDFTRENTGLRVVEADAYDGLEVRNVNVEGQHDTGAYGVARFAINSSDGEGVVESFRIPDGGEFSSQAGTGADTFYGPEGFLSNQYNSGTLTYRNCEAGSFPNSGIYAVGGSGSVHVEGGTYENNNVAQIRLGGNGSSVRNANLVVDESIHSDPDPVNQRALRFGGGASNVTVENVDIEVTDATASSEAILIKADASGVTLRNVDMTLDTDSELRAIWVRGGSNHTIESTSIDHSVGGGTGIFVDDAGSNPGPLTVQNVTFTGSPGIGGGRAAIYNRRDDAVFRNVTVDQNGHPKRNGLVNRGSNVTIDNADS